MTLGTVLSVATLCESVSFGAERCLVPFWCLCYLSLFCFLFILYSAFSLAAAAPLAFARLSGSLIGLYNYLPYVCLYYKITDNLPLAVLSVLRFNIKLGHTSICGSGLLRLAQTSSISCPAVPMYGIMQSICISGLWATFACGVGVQGVGGVVMIY